MKIKITIKVIPVNLVLLFIDWKKTAQSSDETNSRV